MEKINVEKLAMSKMVTNHERLLASISEPLNLIHNEGIENDNMILTANAREENKVQL